MLVTWGTIEIPIHVLLDTGCSTPLITNTFVNRWNILCLEHENPIPIRNFTGDLVFGVGLKYTRPVLLRYRKYYTQEVLEMALMEPEVDVFLPFWWIAKHAPQGAWDSPKLRFSS
jgi:hypothetical protein